MTAPLAPPRRVLAVLDNDESRASLRAAAGLADRHGAALDVFACVEPPHDIGLLARLSGRSEEHLLDALHARRRSEVEAAITTHLSGRAVDIHIGTGKTFIEVIRHVIATDTDYVVKTAEPLGSKRRFLFASTDQHLLRKCPCPVWLQTPDAADAPRRIIASVDVDEWDAPEPETLLSLNLRVIGAALDIAAPSEAEVIVLHAWEAVGEGLIWAFSTDSDARLASQKYANGVLDARQKAMTRLLEAARAAHPGFSSARVQPRLVRGFPEDVIAEESRATRADLVVMGTVARTGLSGVFIGNTAENIINSLQSPVLAVKPPGFVSPLAVR